MPPKRTIGKGAALPTAARKEAPASDPLKQPSRLSRALVARLLFQEARDQYWNKLLQYPTVTDKCEAQRLSEAGELKVEESLLSEEGFTVECVLSRSTHKRALNKITVTVGARWWEVSFAGPAEEIGMTTDDNRILAPFDKAMSDIEKDVALHL